jgi:hypothetical protein
VKKLTGFDRDRLAKGVGFPEALEQFRAWCGSEEVTFLTWGCDDQGIMEQNIIIHDLDWDWIAGWVNLQLIYNLQTDSDRTQKSLATAMEHFEIEQTRIAHDALGDAYNTALICTHMDMAQGLEDYATAAQKLSSRAPKATYNADGPIPVEHVSSDFYPTKAEAFADKAFIRPVCPHCQSEMEYAKWVNQGDQRHMAMATCPEHGKFLIRVRLSDQPDGLTRVSRLTYEATSEAAEAYRQRVEKAEPERRERRRRTRRRRPTEEAASETAE